ncbi:hypothetical protein [Alteriqipengyuania sp. 357]
MHERRAGLGQIDTASAKEGDFLALRPGARARLVSFGKAVAYLLIAAIGMLLVSAIAKGVCGANLLEMAQAGLGMGTLRAILLLIAVVVVPTALMLALTKTPLRLSGWYPDDAPRLAGIGAATGFGLLTVIAAILWAAGAVRFDVSAPSLSSAILNCLISAMLWIALAVGEEGFNRGYAFVQVSQAISFWPAAILSSAWFMVGGTAGREASILILPALVVLIVVIRCVAPDDSPAAPRSHRSAAT